MSTAPGAVVTMAYSGMHAASPSVRGTALNDFAAVLDLTKPPCSVNVLDVSAETSVVQLAGLLESVLRDHPDVEQIAIAIDGVIAGGTSRSFLRRAYPDLYRSEALTSSDGASLPGSSHQYRLIWFACTSPDCEHRAWRVRHDARQAPACDVAGHGEMKPAV